MVATLDHVIYRVDHMPNVVVAMEMLISHLDPTLGDYEIKEDDGCLLFV